MVSVVLASTVVVVVALALFAIASSTLYLNTYAWWDPKTQVRTSYSGLLETESVSFSLIMPCRNEREDVMRATLAALLTQTHSKKEVIISVGHDDPETVATAYRLANEFPELVRVSVDSNETKNKPLQLNRALETCRNDVVGVFDAESIAAKALLSHIDSVFMARNADVVQGAVQLINYRDTWYSLRNCLEYFTWFRSRLHAHSRQGFIPLGGNTVFIKRELLNAVGGWDGSCLAEDCDLGVRLSTLGRRIVVAYSPELVTREETPDSVGTLIRQRTRWSLGFMQVFAKGDWKALPTRRMRLIAWWTLMQQHFMAFAGVCIPVAIIAAVWGNFPLIVTLIAFLPLIPTFATIAFDLCMLREFGRDHRFELSSYDYFRLIVGTPFYQVILAYSALRALVKFQRGDFRWEKTSHAGSHLVYIEQAAVAQS
ncbi:cellulose synthase/poly-beta-1,6-N-acetylglucosamine synthase-like glycosyltransferase [Arthrobacter sp. PL16]|uniref:glycosyltransferase n=1 Tax=Arthrobacter sp. PL16 TaxID=3071720 RepID=UPI002E0C6827|nr:cellulose synthase/poly-beta-1,6-N-acetylglucosamine synthase-like glycosyltransferase [Arthrobacter sp. PL16]